MSVILLELAHTGQTAESTRGLVTVQNTEVGNSHGQLAVTTLAVTEQDEMCRAVHGLESPLALLNIQLEHIVLIVIPVTRLLPKTNIIHVGSLDLLVSALAVLAAKKRLEGVEDLGSGGKQEGATRGNFIEEEQLLLLTNAQVVALLGFHEKFEVGFHRLLVAVVLLSALISSEGDV